MTRFTFSRFISAVNYFSRTKQSLAAESISTQTFCPFKMMGKKQSCEDSANIDAASGEFVSEQRLPHLSVPRDRFPISDCYADFADNHDSNGVMDSDDKVVIKATDFAVDAEGQAAQTAVTASRREVSVAAWRQQALDSAHCGDLHCALPARPARVGLLGLSIPRPFQKQKTVKAFLSKGAMTL